MTEIRYPPEPEPNESRLEYHRRALNAWRMEEKRRLMLERGWICERENCSSRAAQLDEAIVTRGDAMGLSLNKYRLVFCSTNLAVLCPECNTEKAHDREGAWRRAIARYGREAVLEWYLGIGLKVTRHDFLEAL